LVSGCTRMNQVVRFPNRDGSDQLLNTSHPLEVLAQTQLSGPEAVVLEPMRAPSFTLLRRRSSWYYSSVSTPSPESSPVWSQMKCRCRQRLLISLDLLFAPSLPDWGDLDRLRKLPRRRSCQTVLRARAPTGGSSRQEMRRSSAGQVFLRHAGFTSFRC